MAEITQPRQAVVQQAEGHPKVVLRNRGGRGRNIKGVPNGESVTVLPCSSCDEEVVLVKWRKYKGFAKRDNVHSNPDTASKISKNRALVADKKEVRKMLERFYELNDYLGRDEDEDGTWEKEIKKISHRLSKLGFSMTPSKDDEISQIDFTGCDSWLQIPDLLRKRL